MGHKTSVLKVTSRLTVPRDCGAVDAIRLSYRRRTCCGCRRRQIASFSFASNNWVEQLSPEGMLRNVSADVATVHVGKLSKKDGDTAVRVKCLAGKVSVFTTEMSLADLLARLKYTEGGGKAVLSFSLAGRRGADGQAFTALFCNGQRLDNGGAQHLSGPPQQHHQPGRNTEPNTGLHKQVTPDHGVKDVMGDDSPSLSMEEVQEEVMGKKETSLEEEWEFEEEEEVMGEEDPSLLVEWQSEKDEVMGEEDPSLDEGWETEEEVMGEEDPSLDVDWEKDEENAMDKTDPSLKGKEVRESQGHVRGSLWDHVGDCAAVVALGLVFYHAWVEYNTH